MLYSILKIEYFNDRVESFDDYYPCNSKRRDCDNGHVYNWIELDMFHTRITSISIIKKKVFYKILDQNHLVLVLLLLV